MRFIANIRSILPVFLILGLTGTVAVADISLAQPSAEERARERARQTPDRVRDNRDLPDEDSRFGRSAALSAADRQRLDDCVDRMLMGPTKKKVKVRGHEFNCKRYSRWTKSGDFYKVEGQLSHHLTARPDDQVNYSFLVSSTGEIGGLTMNTKSGGFRKIVNQLGGLGNTKMKIGTWYADKFLAAAGRAVDGGWKGSSSLIIGTMAIRIGQSVKLARSGNRGGSQLYWFVDRPGNDIRSVTLRPGRDRPEFCQNLCGNTPNCRAWTLNKNEKTKKSVCWLKGRVGNFVINNRTVSGVRTRGSRPRRGGATIRHGDPESDNRSNRAGRSAAEHRRSPGKLDPLGDDRHGDMEEEEAEYSRERLQR